jgi:hypothetical protein
MRASNIKSIIALLTVTATLAAGGQAVAAGGPGFGAGNDAGMGGYGRGDGGNSGAEEFVEVDDGLQRWVDIVNHADQAIYYVRISNIDDPYYGEDVLGADTIIEPHTAFRVEPPAHNGYCRFDILLTYQDGTELAVRDVNLCEATDIAAWDNGSFDVAYIG